MTVFSLEELMRIIRYHEAGHAIAAYHHGCLITRVSVTDAEYITDYRSPAFGGWVELWGEACITMAGILAEQLAMYGEVSPEEPWADILAFLGDEEEALEAEVYYHDLLDDDHSTLVRLLQQMGNDPMGDDPAEYYRIVVMDSRQLVTDHWTEIDAVARALEQKHTLDGQEVVRIIERTMRAVGSTTP